MTNPRCPTCKGRGFKNEPLPSTIREGARFSPAVMELCDDVYPTGERKGQPCTPRTVFRQHSHIGYGSTRWSNQAVRLPSEKRRETLEMNRQKKIQQAGR